MKWLILVFLLMSVNLFFGQNTYSGKVLDSATHELLPFVNIRVESSQTGFSTDIDGAFYYKMSQPASFFQFSYVGYKTVKKSLLKNEFNVVYLVNKSIGLQEVVIDANYNPAHRIIKEVISNRKSNNPEKNLDYAFESYNKLTFNMELDSASTANADSGAAASFQSFFARQNLMLIETVVKTIHKAPNQTKDVVTASRTSGLQNTMLPMLATELQSFSFYNTFFTLSNIQYISPITNEGFSKYIYTLEQDFIEGKDTVFIISFAPKKGKSFNAMEGVLYISSHKYGIKNVIARPVITEGELDIQINQKYQLIDELWFPEQLNSNIKMSNFSVEGLDLIGKSMSYLKNINLNPTDEDLKFDNISVEIDIENKQQNEEVLEKSRYNPLSARDSLTYHVIDSIGKKANLEKKLQVMESLMEGRIPIGKIDLDLNESFGYNLYEGFRLGAGLYTNHRLMKKITLGGYFAYGFRDKVWKYGGELDVKLWPKKDIGLNVAYVNDIFQSGNSTVGTSKKFVNNQKLYEIYTSLYDAEESWTAKFRFRLKGIKTKLVGKLQRLSPNYKYQYNEVAGSNSVYSPSAFYYSFVGIEASYSPFSRVMYNGYKLIDISQKYPVFSMSYYRTIPYLTSNEISRVLLKISDDFTLPFIGKSNFSIIGGVVSENAPLSYLFNQRGTKNNFNVSVFESFETMTTNEFFATTFVNAFWEQNFGTLFEKGMFRPELAIYQGVGWGSKTNFSLHKYISGKSMEKGYYESGLKLYNIIHSGTSGFGFGTFYRYGPYSLPNFKDNFAYKITLSFGF